MPVVDVTPRRTHSPDLYKRHSTRYRGISYRERADGSRTYAVYFQGKYVTAGATEKDARNKQSDLLGRKARGERVVVNDRTTFAELAESWYESKSHRLRKRTSDYYRSALDLVLLPRFGRLKLAAIDADAISRLVRDLERHGLHAIDPKRPVRPLGRSSIENYLKPLQGVLALAVRRRLIASNPIDVLTADDRPKRTEKESAHEWAEDEITALLDASQRLAEKQESRYDYTPLLRLAATLGLRIGEVLGLRWEDFDRADGMLRVQRQWLRSGEYGPTKTAAGVRRIALPPTLRDDLIALRLRSKASQESDPIFASREGTPLGHRNVTRRGFEPARDLAELPESITFHDLRHAAASRLIDAGLDPVTVAGVLGHEDPSITLKVYAARFNRQRKDDAVRLALSSG
ncbi:MAG TPA: tyrosine-type recombinase/integrase [Gaiellaceae bacterium]|nr:tyrosine-type recombinase/integrase [Gaiellaceae bacterium]